MSIKMKCAECGHIQRVTCIETAHGRYLGSGANWCDECNDGPMHECDDQGNLITKPTPEPTPLEVLRDYVERSTHWRPGGADRHAALQALKQLEEGNS
jgi:hypothetical protein